MMDPPLVDFVNHNYQRTLCRGGCKVNWNQEAPTPNSKVRLPLCPQVRCQMVALCNVSARH